MGTHAALGTSESTNAAGIIQHYQLKIVVYDAQTEEVLQWIE